MSFHLYTDYIFTPIDRNTLHPIENEKGWKELLTVVQAKPDNGTKKGVLSINLHN